MLGHAIEGRRPALADNLLQVFNAPLFLTAEVLFLFGLRQDLRGGTRYRSDGVRHDPRMSLASALGCMSRRRILDRPRRGGILDHHVAGKRP